MVFSQDTGLSDALYQPVAIGLVGLDDPDLDAVVVRQIDVRGRERALRRTGRATWSLERRAPFRGIRIELPGSAVERLGRIETIYYAERHAAPAVDVVVLPAAGWDFSYVDESHAGGEGNLVRSYPLSRSILSRRP